jgi:transposase
MRHTARDLSDDQWKVLDRLIPKPKRRNDGRGRPWKIAATRRGSLAATVTHPGVGPITALATEVFVGDPLRFTDGKALASYIGMIPSEHSREAGSGWVR